MHATWLHCIYPAGPFWLGANPLQAPLQCVSHAPTPFPTAVLTRLASPIHVASPHHSLVQSVSALCNNVVSVFCGAWIFVCNLKRVCGSGSRQWHSGKRPSFPVGRSPLVSPEEKRASRRRETDAVRCIPSPPPRCVTDPEKSPGGSQSGPILVSSRLIIHNLEKQSVAFCGFPSASAWRQLPILAWKQDNDYHHHDRNHHAVDDCHDAYFAATDVGDGISSAIDDDDDRDDVLMSKIGKEENVSAGHVPWQWIGLPTLFLFADASARSAIEYFSAFVPRPFSLFHIFLHHPHYSCVFLTLCFSTTLSHVQN
ncbi:hypothetical protein LSTR_LSTR008934 [Laodelphax striatellus]|uniref:Uncharacterized protein n=1 Tax=Laodelphax striatellus TaxID=195883 RepID=A0A482WLG8_LAOST|nr:hypothetical protein LSTR_LSTR008934 [Laodelphax striatellus]